MEGKEEPSETVMFGLKVFIALVITYWPMFIRYKKF